MWGFLHCRETTLLYLNICLPFQLRSTLKTASLEHTLSFNPTAHRMAKTLWSFGCSECNRDKGRSQTGKAMPSRESNSHKKLFPLVRVAEEHRPILLSFLQRKQFLLLIYLKAYTACMLGPVFTHAVYILLAFLYQFCSLLSQWL